jgi:hypothetical protein
MTALAYAVQFPDAAENLISISGAAAGDTIRDLVALAAA